MFKKDNKDFSPKRLSEIGTSKSQQFILRGTGPYSKKGFAHVYCRDVVMDKMANDETVREAFGYATQTADAITNSRNLLRAVEQFLGIDESFVSQGSRNADRAHILSVQPNPEWMKTPMRSSLLTFIMKSGEKYDGRPVQEWFVDRPDHNSYYGKHIRPNERLGANLAAIFNKPGQGLSILDGVDWNKAKSAAHLGLIHRRITPPKPPVQAAFVDRRRYEDRTVGELRTLAETRNISLHGLTLKADIIQRIRQHN